MQDLDGRVVFTWRTGTSRIVDAIITPDGRRVVAVGTSVPPSSTAASNHASEALALAASRSDGETKRELFGAADERKLHIYNIAERRQER